MSANSYMIMNPFLLLKGVKNEKLLQGGTTYGEGFSFSLKPEASNGVIFYSGSDDRNKKDFFSLAMRNGKLEYRYDPCSYHVTQTS